ncbi:Uncharacterized protein conserved in bacteria [Alteromonadaceae bacterium Bs31]|nr:Uncharacterized protein conserved in bacteria [Alteromonadaceae bacterium Bs31]
MKAPVKAMWNGAVVAESDETVVVESNHYFPVGSIVSEYFRKTDTSTHCPWKGDASYFDLVVGGRTNKDSAWYYPDPKKEAKHIEGMVAFWKGVEIVEA